MSQLTEDVSPGRVGEMERRGGELLTELYDALGEGVCVCVCVTKYNLLALDVHTYMSGGRSLSLSLPTHPY